MPWPARAVLMATVLAVMAGCLPQSVVAPPEPPPEQRVVTGSARGVSSRVQEALAEDGIALVEKGNGRQVRLVGELPPHRAFALVIQQVGKDKVAIAVKWGGRPDPQLWLMVLKALGEQ